MILDIGVCLLSHERKHQNHVAFGLFQRDVNGLYVCIINMNSVDDADSCLKIHCRQSFIFSTVPI